VPAQFVELNLVLALRPIPFREYMNNRTGVVTVGSKCLNSVSNLKLVQIPTYTFEGFLPSSMYLLYLSRMRFAQETVLYLNYDTKKDDTVQDLRGEFVSRY